MSKYDYTENMTALIQNSMSGLSNMYCREDYERVIKAVKTAPKDSRLFRKRELEEMCKHNGTFTAKDLLADDALLKSIPTRQELLDKLIVLIHDLHNNFPSPADYMERIVYSLAPEYRGDTVRTAILKKFIKGAGFQCRYYKIDAIADWTVKKMTADAQAIYKDASEKEKLELLLQWLDDSVFTKDHLVIEMSPLDVLTLLADRISYYTSTLDLRDKEDNPVDLIYEKLNKKTRLLVEKYLEVELKPDISILEVMNEILNKESGVRAQEELFGELVNVLEQDLRSLMRKVYYMNKKKKRSTIAELYKDSKRDEYKKLIKQWKLLLICDELAKGEFKMNGATRVILYHLAIMFGMTIVLKQKDVFDPKTNVVKNLFEDYYNDNLIRYLDQNYSNPQYSSRFEKEPTGEGPNYKNYVEAIYLYYLYRKDLNLSPGERIDAAERLRKSCYELAEKKKKSGVLHLNEYLGGTKEYKNLYVSVMVDLAENALPDFITSHYRILPLDNEPYEAGIRVFSDEEAAYSFVQDILGDLDDAYYRTFLANQFIASSDYGKSVNIEPFIDNMRFEGNPFFEWKLAPLLIEKYPNDTNFVRVITKIHDRLTKEINWIGARKKEFLLELLYILCTQTSENSPLKIKEITSQLKKIDMTANGAMVINGVETLKEVGFDVMRGTDDNDNSAKNKLWIGDKVYQDELLQKTVDYVSHGNRINRTLALKTMDELLKTRIKPDKRISRTTLITIYTAYYVTLLEETEGIDSFPDLSEDFRASIDPYLQECRYQTLSEKNILDMFVLISLYYYLIENHYLT